MEQEQLEKVLKENKDLRDKIQKLYEKLNDNEKELVTLLNNKNYTFVYTDDMIITLKPYVRRIIDYDKLQREYPEIYRDGLVETFSFDEAKKIYDKKIIGKVIQDCKVSTPYQNIKYKKRGSK